MSQGLPIFLDISNRLIVIVGGGTVAARKASAVLAAGARQVRAAAPKFVREFPSQIEKIAEPFAPNHLDGAAIAFAATDSAAVNDAVVAESRKRGILVNRADGEEDDPGDFAMPAVLRCGAITVGVSAAGSPALAAVLRDMLAGSVTDDWVNLAEASRQLRPKIKAAGLTVAKRREIFRALATPQAAEELSRGNLPGLCKWIRKQFPELPELETTSSK